MNAISLLKADHTELKSVMKEISETSDRAVKQRETLLGNMVPLLKAHERIEEEVFYPALRNHPKAKEIVLEGYEEHHAADVLLEELQGVDFGDERWAPKFNVIMENIEHHIGEEEDDMFPKAKQILDPSELTELGSQMEELKASVLASG